MDKTFKAKNGSIRITDSFIEINNEIIYYDNLSGVSVYLATLFKKGKMIVQTKDGKDYTLLIGFTDNELYSKIAKKLNELSGAKYSVTKNEPLTEKESLKLFTKKVICCFCVFLIFVIVIGIFYSMKDAEFDSIDAMSHSQSMVEEYLTAPTTAKFPWSIEEYSIDFNGNQATVSGWVEAENLFGGRVKNTYTVIFDVLIDRKDIYCTSRYVQIGDKVYLNSLN